MPSRAFDPPYDRFLRAAEAVARERSDVDPGIAREVFEEVATLLYDGLALDGLDEHDTAAVIDGLCIDLVSQDPGVAIRARSQSILTDPDGLHDPRAASAAYLISAGLMQL